MPLDYSLTYAGVPLTNDAMTAIRSVTPPKDTARHQLPRTLLDHVAQRFTMEWARDFDPTDYYPGRTTGSLARVHRQDQRPGPRIRLGDWYYPYGASRWSVLRMLATGAQVTAILDAVTPPAAADLVMQCSPVHGASTDVTYTVTSPMMMLPPRQLFEQPGADGAVPADGLYLITLVDERYYWQDVPCSLRVTSSTTWADLLDDVSEALGITVTYSDIEDHWLIPEPDSQLWCNQESAADLLDCLALNVGRTLVRAAGGTYSLLTPTEGAALATASRAALGPVVRQGGGDAFGPSPLDANSPDSVLPSTVRVSFPKFSRLPAGFIDERTGTRQFRDSYGDTFDIDVPIANGGDSVAGLVGNGRVAGVADTAKAVYATPETATPENSDTLTDLATAIAQFRWQSVRLTGLDECYPGTYAWTPDSLHDIVWAWSESRQDASTRVIRREWPAFVKDYQHSADGALSEPIPTPLCCPATRTAVTLAPTETSYQTPDGDSVLYATPATGGSTVYGLGITPDGTVTFVNTGTDAITFVGNSPLAVPLERITLPSGVGTSLTIYPNDTVTFTNDTVTDKVRLTETTAGQSFTSTIGDGVNTTFTVEHGLGTGAISVSVIRTSDGQFVIPTVRRTGTGTITVTFGAPPPIDSHEVVIQKGGAGSGTTAIEDGATLTTGLKFPPTGLTVIDELTGKDLTITSSGIPTDSTVTFTGPVTFTPYGSALVSSPNQATALTELGLATTDTPTFTGVITQTVTGGLNPGANVVIQGNPTGTAGRIDLLANTDLTAAVVDVAKARALSTGTPAVGFGAAFTYSMKNASGTELTAGRTSAVFTDATAASEDADYVITSLRGGSLVEQARMTSQGAMRFAEISTPATPATGTVLIYPKSDGSFYSLDDAGNETELGGSPPTPPTTVSLSATPTWFLVKTITHTDLTDADTQQDITAYSLPAKASCLAGIVRTKTAGAGGGLMFLNVAFLVDNYSTTFGDACDGMLVNDIGSCQPDGSSFLLLKSWSAATDIKLQFASTGDNLDNITAGEWEVYLLLSTLG